MMATNPKATRLKLDKAALFRHIGYEPHAGQLAVHSSKAPRRVVACGVRWGKSVCAAMEAVAGAMAPAESSLGWIVTPSYALTDLLFQQVRMVIESKLPHRIVRVESRERLIVLRNLLGGVSEIRGRSAENPSNLLGAGLDWLVVDECAALRDDVWRSYLAGRLVDRKGWALFVSTPRGRNWFYQLFLMGVDGQDPAFESWTQPSWANPLLDRSVIEAERSRVPEHVYFQEFGGEFLTPLGRSCGTCQWPERQGSGIVTVLNHEAIAQCPGCERPVSADGSPLSIADENGEARLTVISVELPVSSTNGGA